MANEIYDSTWWGNTIQTASSIGTSTEMIQGQFNLTKLGDELVTNGDFENGTNGWTINSNALGYVSTSSQTLQYLIGHGDYAEVKQLNNSIIGKKYRGQFEVISKGTNATVFLQYGRTLFYSGDINNLDLGVHTFEVVSSHSDGFGISVRTNGIIEIDNVSVKEVRAIEVEAKKCLADAIHRIGIQDIQN